MSHQIKLSAPKFSEEIADLVSYSEFVNHIENGGKTDNEEISAFIGKSQVSAKKRKTATSSHAGTKFPETVKNSNANMDTPEDTRQKLLDVMSRQLHTRKIENEKLLKDLSDVIQKLEADYIVMNENKQTLEQITRSFINCIHQATTAYKQKLDTLKEIYASYKRQFNETEAKHETETYELADELYKDELKLQMEAILETKMNGLNPVRREIFQAILDYGF